MAWPMPAMVTWLSNEEGLVTEAEIDEAVADVVARHGRRLLIDSMSAFGALPLDSRVVPFDAVAASSNKCIEGIPGFSYVILKKEMLLAAEGQTVEVGTAIIAVETAADVTVPEASATAEVVEAVHEHQATGAVPVELLERLAASGMTMVLVTHEMGFARRTADTLVFMHQGKVWEKGPPRELFAAPKTRELESFIQAILEPND